MAAVMAKNFIRSERRWGAAGRAPMLGGSATGRGISERIRLAAILASAMRRIRALDILRLVLMALSSGPESLATVISATRGIGGHGCQEFCAGERWCYHFNSSTLIAQVYTMPGSCQEPSTAMIRRPTHSATGTATAFPSIR